MSSKQGNECRCSSMECSLHRHLVFRRWAHEGTLRPSARRPQDHRIRSSLFLTPLPGGPSLSSFMSGTKKDVVGCRHILGAVVTSFPATRL